MCQDFVEQWQMHCVKPICRMNLLKSSSNPKQLFRLCQLHIKSQINMKAQLLIKPFDKYLILEPDKIMISGGFASEPNS